MAEPTKNKLIRRVRGADLARKYAENAIAEGNWAAAATHLADMASQAADAHRLALDLQLAANQKGR